MKEIVSSKKYIKYEICKTIVSKIVDLIMEKPLLHNFDLQFNIYSSIYPSILAHISPI